MNAFSDVGSTPTISTKQNKPLFKRKMFKIVVFYLRFYLLIYFYKNYINFYLMVTYWKPKLNNKKGAW